MDKGKQIVMINNASCGSNNSNNWKNNDSLIDRSKVKILLWESNAESCEEVSTLLSQCGYQVIPALSAVEMNDVLNAEGPNVDIVLFEVSLIMDIGMKMLNYMRHDKDLQHIPVIMLSTQERLSLIHKGLQHGAADFLVKPLRTNELLNLWTHMRKRQHLLGQPQNIFKHDFRSVVSNPSNASVNNNIQFSDDARDKSS